MSRWPTHVRNLVLAFAAGGALFVWVNGEDLPRRCADGWRSPSIGSVGACSHHGGVVSGLRFVPWWKQALPFAVGALLLTLPGWQAVSFRQSRPRDPVVALMVRAIDEGRSIGFFYTKPGRDPEWRTVTPIKLTHVGARQSSSRCLIGYCHARQANRTFILSRIDQATLSDTGA